MSLAGVFHLPAFIRAGTGSVRWFWNRRVGSVETNDVILRAWSPVLYPWVFKSPVLIAHGTSDSRVPRVQSDVLVTALRSSGKSVLYLVMPGFAHEWDDHQNQQRFLALTEFFLAQTLGGAVEPPAPHEEWKAFLR